MASVMRKAGFSAGLYSDVGWNCMNSKSLNTPLALCTIATPSPVETIGVVVVV